MDKKQAEKKSVNKHVLRHRNNLKHLKERHKIINELLKLVGRVILRILLIHLCNSLRKSNILQLKTKNNKILNLRPKHANKTSQIPFKNLSDYDIDTSILKYGLTHSFINKRKFIKSDLAVEFESLAATVDELVTQEQREEFHEFLRHTTDLLSQNVYHTEDNTFKETHKIRNNNNVVILPGIYIVLRKYTRVIHNLLILTLHIILM